LVRTGIARISQEVGMARWPWIERTFDFDYPVGKFPDVLERFRGTPARLEEAVAGLEAEVLTRRDEVGWSIQENVGHLLDVEDLWSRRMDDFLAGAAELCPADMTNRRTHEADHNAKKITALLAAFRAAREELVGRLERLDETAWAKTALHPRLKQPMRVVDLVFFVCEHDDYHLARIRALRRKYT